MNKLGDLGGFKLSKDRLLDEYRIRIEISRPNPELYKDFEDYPTAAISDAMRSRNVMTSNIKPVWGPCPRLVGPAITVNASVGDEILIHKAIETAKPGDVIVVAGNAKAYTAYWGGIMSTMAKVRKIKGLVTDGMIRDIGEVRELRFPIWATGITPIAPKTDCPPGDLNIPISIGEVVVHPGDLVVADEDGVVIVPKDMIEGVSKAVKARVAMEKEWVKEINSTKQNILRHQINTLLENRKVEYLD